MTPLVGPLLSATVLVAGAGVAKLAIPAPSRVALRTAGLWSSAWAVRLLGTAELALAAAILAGTGQSGANRAAVAALAALYGGFAWFSARVAKVGRGRAGCGCFGREEAPVTALHVWVNVAIAVVVAGAAFDPPDGLAEVADQTPGHGLVVLALAALGAWLTYVALTVLPRTLAAQRPPSPSRSRASTAVTP